METETPLFQDDLGTDYLVDTKEIVRKIMILKFKIFQTFIQINNEFIKFYFIYFKNLLKIQNFNNF